MTTVGAHSQFFFTRGRPLHRRTPTPTLCLPIERGDYTF